MTEPRAHERRIILGPGTGFTFSQETISRYRVD